MYTQHDLKELYVIGNADMNEWRKFTMTNEQGQTIYVSCLQCLKLNKEINPGKLILKTTINIIKSSPTIARGIINDGILKSMGRHNDLCYPQKIEAIEAEQLIREQRRVVGKDPNIPLKSLWRKVDF